MEINARVQSLQSSMDHCINEAHHEENILATSEARGNIIDLRNQIEDLTKRLGDMREEVDRAFKWVFTTESQQDEALVQLSTLEESCRLHDEAQA